MRGTMRWFNEAKNYGSIATQDGESIHVDGSAFPGGKGLVGRCKGLEVTFEVTGEDETRSAVDVSVVPYIAPRRARRRRGA